LPIFIGSPEATAIAYALQGVDMPRPLTHDLMKDMLDALTIGVERVVITELRGSTYYAEIHLLREGVRTVVSSRPSDAVAVAVRTETPLFVSDDLMESEGIVLALESEEDEEAQEVPDELVGQFRQFLDSVRPEDFEG
jgi:bifunctional DNase/RNase